MQDSCTSNGEMGGNDIATIFSEDRKELPCKGNWSYAQRREFLHLMQLPIVIRR
jgi:hypothetical protein